MDNARDAEAVIRGKRENMRPFERAAGQLPLYDPDTNVENVDMLSELLAYIGEAQGREDPLGPAQLQPELEAQSEQIGQLLLEQVRFRVLWSVGGGEGVTCPVSDVVMLWVSDFFFVCVCVF